MKYVVVTHTYSTGVNCVKNEFHELVVSALNSLMSVFAALLLSALLKVLNLTYPLTYHSLHS